MSELFDKQIKKYGFLIQDIYTWEDIIIRIFFIIVIIPFIPLIILTVFVILMFSGDFSLSPSSGFDTNLAIWGMLLYVFSILVILGIGYYFIRIFGGFLIAGRIYYTRKHAIVAGEVYEKFTYSDLRKKLNKFHFSPLSGALLEEDRMNIKKIIAKVIGFYKRLWGRTWGKNFSLRTLFESIFIMAFPILCLITWKFFLGIELQLVQASGYVHILYGTLWIIFGMLTIAIIFSFFYRIYNPLYAFGNIGQKIQSLTLRISEQSEQIEREFRGDMDFRVLSRSFDSLASTFSEIVRLVVKLERVEKKANKGDLFDSNKYINSLRDDIRTPLLSLKGFLEKKKTELETSQKELSRVRVSVGGESENRELQSLRCQELITELDENIGKLGVMIEKLV